MSQTPSSLSRTVLTTDLAGRQLGDFQLLRRLGSGGMADVYLAEQQSLKRQVAVKVLKGELATDATYIERFRREAQAAAALVHSNIVQIHEVSCVDGIHFIVQEYVSGQSLREMISRNGPPDLKQSVVIMRQVAAALDRAAQRGIIHRDIKPENIMLARDGEVKVADFGLARLSHASGNTTLTQAGMTMGTPLYMSPEQVEGKPLDPRSDLYSFGVTCYHMLAGLPPFQGATALSVAVQHLRTPPRRLEELRPDLPAALCRVVHKLLEKDPADRHQTAGELLRDLRALQVEGLEGDWPESFSGSGAAGFTSSTDGRSAATQRLAAVMKNAPVPAPERRRWWLLGAVMLLAFAAGAALAWARRERPLLADIDLNQTMIGKRPTAQQQYEFALRFPTEEAWLSVRLHFPEDDYYAGLADQELAMLYLERDDYPAALRTFGRLSNASELEPEVQAFGLAGECVVLCLEGQHVASTAKLNQLYPLRDKLTNPSLRLLLRHAIEENRRQLNPQTPNQWAAWGHQRFEDEAAD